MSPTKLPENYIQV